MLEWVALVQYKLYKCSSFVLNRHADREAEPKNYNVTKSDIDERDLLRAILLMTGLATSLMAGVSKLMF